MVYLIKMVIFHGKLLNNQRVYRQEGCSRPGLEIDYCSSCLVGTQEQHVKPSASPMLDCKIANALVRDRIHMPILNIPNLIPQPTLASSCASSVPKSGKPSLLR
jgi:hypothetical protein